jgi:hypothetical protein
MVSVPPASRPIVSVEAVGAIVKLPVPEGAVTVMGKVMVLVTVPSLTETVIVDVPTIAALLAVNVIR